MPRTVDTAAHARRRDEYLDAAQRLIEAKGYEQMSIQDVLDEAGTSRGAFYHYFGSKQELAFAVVGRFARDLASFLAPIADDPRLSALDKLRGLFAQLTVKDPEHEALVNTMRVWYFDGNARLRQKARVAIIDQLAHALRPVIVQGVAEHAFVVSDPETTGTVVATLVQDLNDYLERQLGDDAGDMDMPVAGRTVAAYSRAVERILGAPEGSVVIFDMAMLRAWFGPRGATKETNATDESPA